MVKKLFTNFKNLHNRIPESAVNIQNKCAPNNNEHFDYEEIKENSPKYLNEAALELGVKLKNKITVIS